MTTYPEWCGAHRPWLPTRSTNKLGSKAVTGAAHLDLRQRLRMVAGRGLVLDFVPALVLDLVPALVVSLQEE